MPLFSGPSKGASGGFSVPGVLPHRHAIVSVVGSPVLVPAPIAEPTQAQIDEYRHAQSMDALPSRG